ncbi:MAG: hypothetical protein N2F24_07280 [Deltaproteobacteria bacterium]
MAAQPKTIERLIPVLKKVKITAIVVSFIVFAVASMAGTYVRANLILKKHVKIYVSQNMPSDLSGEERKEKAASLYWEFMEKPMQRITTLAILLVAFMVGGYAAGTMSDHYINAVLAAIAAALLLASQLNSVTYLVTILIGMWFSLVGSKIAFYRKQLMNRG